MIKKLNYEFCPIIKVTDADGKYVKVSKTFNYYASQKQTVDIRIYAGNDYSLARNQYEVTVIGLGGDALVRLPKPYVVSESHKSPEITVNKNDRSFVWQITPAHEFMFMPTVQIYDQDHRLIEVDVSVANGLLTVSGRAPSDHDLAKGYFNAVIVGKAEDIAELIGFETISEFRRENDVLIADLQKYYEHCPILKLLDLNDKEIICDITFRDNLNSQNVIIKSYGELIEGKYKLQVMGKTYCGSGVPTMNSETYSNPELIKDGDGFVWKIELANSYASSPIVQLTDKEGTLVKSKSEIKTTAEAIEIKIHDNNKEILEADLYSVSVFGPASE